MSKIMVAMSGGVDSSAVALKLINEGHQVAGGTLILHDKNVQMSEKSCGSSKDVNDAKSVCEKLNIEHFIFDYQEDFKKNVMDKFVSVYRAGGTPNPCILCNRWVKFPKMIAEAKACGYTHVATGHYARVKYDENSKRYMLLRPADTKKDQTYVLYNLTQEELSHILFPLGEIEDKESVRKMAEDGGLVNARKPDSQDICFVPDGDYSAFIERFTGKSETEGSFVNKKGEFIAKSKGISSYTIGQRKGLGVALGKPQFVIKKDLEENKIYLGDESDLFTTNATVTDVNLISIEKLISPMEVTAKTRYSQKEAKAVISPLVNGDIKLEFSEPQRAITSGQSAVFYDGDTVVGGGIIK